MGILGWIIIIWIIVVCVKVSQKNGWTYKADRTQTSMEKPQMKTRIEKNVKKGYQTVTEQVRKYETVTNPEELKRRLMQKYSTGDMHKKPDILERASANTAEDFEEEHIARSGQKKKEQNNTEEFFSNKSFSAENISQIANVQQVVAGITRNGMAQATRLLAEVDLCKIYDIPQIPQESELMKKVSDIMAKGMDTEPAFSRDFVAEGLDMINNTL